MEDEPKDLKSDHPQERFVTRLPQDYRGVPFAFRERQVAFGYSARNRCAIGQRECHRALGREIERLPNVVGHKGIGRATVDQKSHRRLLAGWSRQHAFEVCDAHINTSLPQEYKDMECHPPGQRTFALTVWRAQYDNTAMNTEASVVDCDGHILEPPDLWEKYLEPKYRERAMRIRVDDEGWEYLEIDRKRAKMTRRGLLGNLGGMRKRVTDVARLRDLAAQGKIAPADLARLQPTPTDTYLKGVAFGAMDMKERLTLLDREQMAKALLYPTIGLLWEAELFDAELSAAYCRAYNRWIADFCRDSAGRLVPIAHLSLGDPAEAARELQRAVKDGCRGGFVCPFTITRKT